MNAPHSTPPAIRVLVVEDQGMFRSFLESWLSREPGFVLAGSMATGEEALRAVASLSPDIALIDLQLPGMDGIALVQALRQLRPHMRTLILSSLIDPLALTRVRECGAEGYLEKDAPPETLALALRTVASGKPFFSKRFTETLASEGSKSEALGKILSRREQQVLTLVLAGHTNREIADSITLSPRTVEFHRANLMAKLGAANLTELLARARQRGWA